MKTDDVLLEYCLLKFDQLTHLVSEMGDRLANAKPGIVGANTPVAILVHCCGMMRRWSSSVNLGFCIPRDREAEFTTQMTTAEVSILAGQTRSAFEHDVRQTIMDQAPVAVPSTREAFWTITCHGVLLHVFEELCQHLGQAELTRDLLTAGESLTSEM